jgi:hypothetical protein
MINSCLLVLEKENAKSDEIDENPPESEIRESFWTATQICWNITIVATLSRYTLSPQLKLWLFFPSIKIAATEFFR